MTESLDDEHARLIKQTADLQREHERVEAEELVPGPDHHAHKLRLREQISELREHLARLEEKRRTGNVE